MTQIIRENSRRKFRGERGARSKLCGAYTDIRNKQFDVAIEVPRKTDKAILRRKFGVRQGAMSEGDGRVHRYASEPERISNPGVPEKSEILWGGA